MFEPHPFDASDWLDLCGVQLTLDAGR